MTVGCDDLRPKPSDIQGVCVFVSILHADICACVYVAVDYVRCPVAGRVTILAPDFSVRQTITAVTLDYE